MIAGIALTTATTICGIALAIDLMISGRASARAMMITGITDITALTISPACSSTVVATATTNCITCCNIVGKSSTRNATILSIIIPMFACIVGSAEIKPETMFSTAATAASKNAGMVGMSLRKKSPMPAQKLVTASCADARSNVAIQLMALHALDRKFFTAVKPDASDDASFLPAFLSAVFIALSVAASRVTPNNALTTKSFALLIPSPIFSDTALPTSAHFLYRALDLRPFSTGAITEDIFFFIEEMFFFKLSMNN